MEVSDELHNPAALPPGKDPPPPIPLVGGGGGVVPGWNLDLEMEYLD